MSFIFAIYTSPRVPVDPSSSSGTAPKCPIELAQVYKAEGDEGGRQMFSVNRNHPGVYFLKDPTFIKLLFSSHYQRLKVSSGKKQVNSLEAVFHSTSKSSDGDKRFISVLEFNLDVSNQKINFRHSFTPKSNDDAYDFATVLANDKLSVLELKYVSVFL